MFQVPGWAVVLLCLAVAANVAVLVKIKLTNRNPSFRYVKNNRRKVGVGQMLTKAVV